MADADHFISHAEPRADLARDDIVRQYEALYEDAVR